MKRAVATAATRTTPMIAHLRLPIIDPPVAMHSGQPCQRAKVTDAGKLLKYVAFASFVSIASPGNSVEETIAG
jgi:hypothetical protein